MGSLQDRYEIYAAQETKIQNERNLAMGSVFKKPEPIKQARQYLIDIYLDWRNNYLSIEKFAEDNGLHYTQASKLLQLGAEVFESEHPES